MRQDQLAPAVGARHRRKRVGRGDGSGHGSYSGRGVKGQKARAGKGPRPGFEGGQLPLIKRLPEQRGFTNIFRREYAEVNLEQLDRFPAGAEVSPQTMREVGLVKDHLPVKVLAKGDIDRPLTVIAHRFSKQARQKILEAGGQVREVGP